MWTRVVIEEIVKFKQGIKFMRLDESMDDDVWR